MNTSTGLPRIGLALGSGASRGWSHIGILRALLEAGIEPDVVCGTSVGARTMKPGSEIEISIPGIGSLHNSFDDFPA